MDKQHIIDAIRNTATYNGGEPLGRARFLKETGIRETDWSGKFWSRWSDAVEEAGLTPLRFQGKGDRATALKKLAELTRRFGRLPTTPEMKLEKRSDPLFSNHNSLLGKGRAALIQELHEYCHSHQGFEDVELILKAIPAKGDSEEPTEHNDSKPQFGYVYLVASAKKYKIGYSKAALSRTSVISNMSPEGGEIIHLIRTDDMRGIEAYWHSRFADKRGNGEWFSLSGADGTAFKRRKFM